MERRHTFNLTIVRVTNTDRRKGGWLLREAWHTRSKSCPFARLKCPLAKPWLSRHFVVMHEQKKKLYKKFCLHVPKSTGLATKTITGFTPGFPGQFMNRMSLRMQSENRKSSSGISVRGQKRGTPSPSWADQMSPSKQMMFSQPFWNCIHTWKFPPRNSSTKPHSCC